ncbi:MAG TPA: Mov34/MPN/PAD-1 family protein [Candidatus Lokiarchaeia archaeon]
MEKIEQQYQKIVLKFPETIVIDNSITHVRIPLKENIFLDINYKKYPKKPKIKFIKSEGQIYSKLDSILPSLKNWGKEKPLDVVNLVDDIIRFIKNLESREVAIKKELLMGILGLCRDQHPREILGLLRIENGITTEFILPPGALRSEQSGVFSPNRLGIDPTLEGTVHSHPSGLALPSAEDLKLFRKYRFNFIIGFPYNLNGIKCYDANGAELKVEVIP